MNVVRKLLPGQDGTKRFVSQYGDRLVCVRYRTKPETNQKFITVELIVDAADKSSQTHPIDYQRDTLPSESLPKGNEYALLRVEYHEKELQLQVKQAGGKWLPHLKLWQLPYHKIRQMKLEDRYVKQDVDSLPLDNMSSINQDMATARQFSPESRRNR